MSARWHLLAVIPPLRCAALFCYVTVYNACSALHACHRELLELMYSLHCPDDGRDAILSPSGNNAGRYNAVRHINKGLKQKPSRCHTH